MLGPLLLGMPGKGEQSTYVFAGLTAKLGLPFGIQTHASPPNRPRQTRATEVRDSERAAVQ